MLLKKLNVSSTAIGFESGNEEMLKYLKSDSVTVKDHKRAILLMEKYKIPCFGSFIFASPEETLEQMKDTLNLIKFAYKHKIGFIYPFLMKPYPGTEIWEIAKKKGKVSDNMDWELLGTFIEDINEQNKPLTLDENIDIQEFKKVYNTALKYAKLISIKRLIRSFLIHPISTICYIGNPITFIKERYNLIKKGTLAYLKPEKG